MESAIVLTVRASIYPHSHVTVTWLDEDAARRLQAQSEMLVSRRLERRREDDVQEDVEGGGGSFRTDEFSGGFAQ